MVDTKLSLSVILPGSTMFSTEESVKQLKKPVRNKSGKTVLKRGKVVYKEVTVPDFDKHDSFELQLKEKGKTEVIKVLVRKSRPAKQVINLTEAAYNYMVSKECPAGFRGSWDKLSLKQKLYWHCQQIAIQLGGKLESYEVLD